MATFSGTIYYIPNLEIQIFYNTTVMDHLLTCQFIYSDTCMHDFNNCFLWDLFFSSAIRNTHELQSIHDDLP